MREAKRVVMFVPSSLADVFHTVTLKNAYGMPTPLQPSLPANGNQPVIDVLVLYTANAMFDSKSLSGAERSNAQMETEIAASYQGANEALDSSGVEFAIRVVHMQEVLSVHQFVGVATPAEKL